MYDFTLVLLYLNDGPETVLRCVKSNLDQTHLVPDKDADAIARYVGATQSPFVTGNGDLDQRLGTLIDARISGTVFCGPVRSAESVGGVLFASTPLAMGALAESSFNAFAAYCNIAAIAIQNSTRNRQLEEEKVCLERIVINSAGCSDLIGCSDVMASLREKIASVGASPLDVLIVGECGTGKELVARGLHRCGRRAERVLISVDCGSLSDNLIESELFGYRKGAFTGANESRAGLIEAANGGVLFLDEVSNLPMRLQAKLLRVLQEREVRRIGEVNTRKVDIQVYAATNRDLIAEIRKGGFRKDLFYRLRGVEIRVPALREHRQDIAELVGHFSNELAAAEQGKRKVFSRRAIAALCAYSFPGNVRELRSAVRSSYYSSSSNVIELLDLPPEISGDAQGEGNSPLAESIIDAVRKGSGDFAGLVKMPFLRHEFGADVLREIVRAFLRDAGGKYRLAFRALRVPEREYSVTIQFLKRHNAYIDFRLYRN